jgi:type II secretion system protein D
VGGLAATEATPLIDLRITVDLRSNSVIVAGSPSDVEIIGALISRMDDADVPLRRTEVYHLRNAAAADVANALNSFFTTDNSIKTSSGTLTPYQIYQQAVAVVAEPVSNKLIISATPTYFDQVMAVIHAIDQEPPQVVIQVLVAEVDLNGTEEFGVEIGLQTPVLFQRGIFPATSFLTGSSTSLSAATSSSGTLLPNSLLPQGVTVNTTNPVGQPGFNFNTTDNLGNNVAVNPGLVGYQGLSTLGVGRISPISGVGGFVFSAASQSFNLLIRALKTQGRIDVLSRPQLQTLDNQAASILVGQYFPYVNASNVTTGVVSTSVSYASVGVQLKVVPRISPDGKILMRVTPEISSVGSQMINIGGGATATAFNTQTVDTTILAADGETVAIGGLIVKRDQKSENKIPWLGDLPGVGALFRYRTQQKMKTELLVILTPHIVRSRMEADAILAAESHRMDWILGDVAKVHATTGMEGVLPPPKDAPPAGPPQGPGPGMPPPNAGMPYQVPMMQPQGPMTQPQGPMTQPQGPVMGEPAHEMLPPPRQPGPSSPGQAPMNPATQAASVAPVPAGSQLPLGSLPPPGGPPLPESQQVPVAAPVPVETGPRNNGESPNLPPSGTVRPLR